MENSKFRDSDRLISQIFPELALTANQIFQGGVSNCIVVHLCLQVIHKTHLVSFSKPLSESV
jgi:hypothetical protein